MPSSNPIILSLTGLAKSVPGGRVLFENLDLCEYLASQGYVVLASRSLGPRSTLMTVDVEGVEAQAADIAFLANYARSLPQADMSKFMEEVNRNLELVEEMGQPTVNKDGSTGPSQLQKYKLQESGKTVTRRQGRQIAGQIQSQFSE